MSRSAVTTLAVGLVLGAMAYAGPLDVTDNLIIHLDASQGVVLDVGGVAQWWDQAARGGIQEAQMADPNRRPDLIPGAVGGLPAIRFDGVNDSLLILDNVTGGLLDGNNTISWFAVFQQDPVPSGTDVLLRTQYTGAGGSDRLWGTFTQPGLTYSHSRTSTGSFRGQSNGASADYATLSAVWDGAGPSQPIRQWLNGVPGTPHPSGDTGADNPATTFDRLRIGADERGTNMSGEIAEILVYDTALSTADRGRVENYLSVKYGFVAPSAGLPVTDGLLLHLDGDNVATDGSGSVAAWLDRALDVDAQGGPNNFGQNDTGRRPTLVADAINGLPALDFDGAGDFLNRERDPAFDTATGNWTSFIVFQADDDPIGSAQSLMRSGYDDHVNDPGDQGHDYVWGSFIQDDDVYGHSRKQSSHSFVGATAGDDSADTGWHMQSLVIAGTPALDPSVAQWIDGAPAGSQVSDSAQFMVGHRRTNIGANSNSATSPSTPFDGRIAEIVVYQDTLTPHERREVQEYLHGKYFGTNAPPVGLPIHDKLRLHATMDDADIVGTTVLDTGTGTAQNGTIVGLPGITAGNAGQIGQALRFVGSDSDRLDFGNAMDPGDGGFTVSLWINPDDVSGTEMVASKGNSYSTHRGWSIWMSGDDLFVRGQQVGGTNDERFGQWVPDALTAGQWQHVALVLDRENDLIRGYLNGSNVGWLDGGGGAQVGELIDGSLVLTEEPLWLGRRFQAGAPYEGLVDDFAIWDRALTPGEIQMVYDFGLAGVDVSRIPEPATLLLLGCGVGGLGLRRRRR